MSSRTFLSLLNKLSFRTERSVVKNLVYIHVYVTEILRFALNDKNGLVNDKWL